MADTQLLQRDSRGLSGNCSRTGENTFVLQSATTFPTVWVAREQVLAVLGYLNDLPRPYSMLYDLSAIDERLRTHRRGLPSADYTVFYHLVSIERNSVYESSGPAEPTPEVCPRPPASGPMQTGTKKSGTCSESFRVIPAGAHYASALLDWASPSQRITRRATEFDPFMLNAAKQDMGRKPCASNRKNGA